MLGDFPLPPINNNLTNKSVDAYPLLTKQIT